MNNQKIEKQITRDGGLVEIHHIFGPTIQGEGPFAGAPAVFVRLAGCNLQCPGCDTNYTSERTIMTPKQVVDKVAEYAKGDRGYYKFNSPYLVVVTGGEPFRQNIGPMVRELITAGYRVQIETNGTLYTPGPWEQVTIVCSPKTGKIDPKLAKYIDAFKYVVEHGDVDPTDGLPLYGLHKGTTKIARPPYTFNGTIYLQPFDDGSYLLNNPHLNACIFNCLRFGYTLCLQIHKMVGLE